MIHYLLYILLLLIIISAVLWCKLLDLPMFDTIVSYSLCAVVGILWIEAAFPQSILLYITFGAAAIDIIVCFYSEEVQIFLLYAYLIVKLNCGYILPKETTEAPSAYVRNIKEYFKESYNEIEGL